MREFDEIFAIAAKRKGGQEALEKLLTRPKSAGELAQIADDRWLSAMTRCVFQAGFNRKVVANMWPGFEEAFSGFDIGICLMLHDDDFDRLVSDKRIVRHQAKIRAVQQNAMLVAQLKKEAGSAGQAFGNWPSNDYVALLSMIKKRGSRLGGNSGQYFLRFMGVDGFILSRDVVARLVAEGVVDKPASPQKASPPSSQKAMVAIQEAFNVWQQQSGRSLNEISQVLAMSID